MAPLTQFLNKYYDGVTDEKFQPIFKEPNTELNGLVCIFHGLGSDPRQYNHLVDFLTSKDYAACSFGLPGHRSSNSDEFSLTNDTINNFVTSLTTALSNLHYRDIKLFFIGVSFGASFARHFADHFNRPLINAAPFVEPFQWGGYLTLKFLSALDWIPLLSLGTHLSKSLPKIQIVSPKHMPKNGALGLSKLPAFAIFNSYSWAQRCHFMPIKTRSIFILLAKNDQTISNQSVASLYWKAEIKEYKAPHNLLSQIGNKTDVINQINTDIVQFLNNPIENQPIKSVHPFIYLKALYQVLIKLTRQLIINTKIQINDE